MIASKIGAEKMENNSEVVNDYIFTPIGQRKNTTKMQRDRQEFMWKCYNLRIVNAHLKRS